MARKVNYVTRTYDLTQVTVLQMNPGEGEPYNHVYEVNGTVKDQKKLLKKLRDKYEDPATLVICAIVDTKKVKKMVGCPEDIFFANAVELDEKTRRPKYPEPFSSDHEVTGVATEQADGNQQA